MIQLVSNISLNDLWSGRNQNDPVLRGGPRKLFLVESQEVWEEEEAWGIGERTPEMKNIWRQKGGGTNDCSRHVSDGSELCWSRKIGSWAARQLIFIWTGS